MSSVAEVKGLLNQIGASMDTEVAAGILQVKEAIEQQIQLLNSTLEGTNAESAQAALALMQGLLEELEDMINKAMGIKEHVEQYAAVL